MPTPPPAPRTGIERARTPEPSQASPERNRYPGLGETRGRRCGRLRQLWRRSGRISAQERVRRTARDGCPRICGWPLGEAAPRRRALGGYLRPLAGETELACVGTTLREDRTVIADGWLKRSKATQTKLTAGQTVGLAEVVRDSAGRDRPPGADGKTVRLSPSEQQLYLKARQLLADEIGLVRGIESSEADDWIADQLSQTPVKRSKVAIRPTRTARIGL